MAITPDEVKGEIALELDVAKVSTADFINAAEAFIGLIKEVSKTFLTDLPRDSWEISVNEGSQVINIYPNLSKITHQHAHQISEVILDGIRKIEESADNPFSDNDKAVEHIRTLGRIASRDKTHVPIRCLTSKSARPISKIVFKHANEILSWQYEDAGTVDGVLDVVSAHNGYEFSVSETLYNKPVKCIVNETLLEKALKSFRKRVEVVGLISYNRHGQPKSVKASDIIQFPEDVPHYTELRGIFGEA